jgi:hypothetical protein
MGNHTPPSTEAATLDIECAYRNSMIAAKHKAYMAVMWLSMIYVEHCAVFSLTPAGGIQGTPANAAVEIFKFKGIDHIIKWVDDFAFFRIPIHSFSNGSHTVYTYHYDLATIHSISAPLGIPWHPVSSKGQDFAATFEYAGFGWDLRARSVSLPDKK